MCKSKTAFIPLAEAAELLTTTETRILMMLKRNELVGKQEDDAWYVDRSSLKLCEKPKPSDIIKSGCGSGCGSCGGH